MPTRRDVAESFDRIAADYDAKRRRPWKMTHAFAALLPPSSSILDLGCGNGRNVGPFVDAGHRVTGLDASPGLLSFAAMKMGFRSLVLGDALSLPFRTSSFDAVHSIAAIHHLPSEREREQMVEECERVVRARGLVMVSAWAREQERFRLLGPEQVDVHVPWRRGGGHTAVERFYHLFREEELERLIEGGGFKVRRAWREGDNHVVLAAKQ